MLEWFCKQRTFFEPPCSRYKILMSLSFLQGEFKSKAEQAIQAGEQFCELYYDIFDNKRHVSSVIITEFVSVSTCFLSDISYQLKVLGYSRLQPFKCVIFFQQLAKLFTTSSVQIWNGNSNTGEAKIVEFITNLPSSEHVIHSLDCQPVLGESL